MIELIKILCLTPLFYLSFVAGRKIILKGYEDKASDEAYYWWKKDRRKTVEKRSVK